MVYNLEYRVLDKLGRTKSTFHGGVFKSEEAVNLAKETIEKNNPDSKIAFDVYFIDDPFLPIQ